MAQDQIKISPSTFVVVFVFQFEPNDKFPERKMGKSENAVLRLGDNSIEDLLSGRRIFNIMEPWAGALV